MAQEVGFGRLRAGGPLCSCDSQGKSHTPHADNHAGALTECQWNGSATRTADTLPHLCGCGWSVQLAAGGSGLEALVLRLPSDGDIRPGMRPQCWRGCGPDRPSQLLLPRVPITIHPSVCLYFLGYSRGVWWLLSLQHPLRPQLLQLLHQKLPQLLP
uniref:Uncharacterized protein n=1 Tax=Eutreptiella gymnastica TaxID=73025 RepID=A0A7S1NFU0_9EUGL